MPLASRPALRPRPTVRAVLDAAGRIPPDVAARIGIDVAAALAAAHRDGAAGEGDAPALLDAARIEIGERGEIGLTGLGLARRDAAADVRALGAVLHECLAGEPPGEPRIPLDVPGVPPPLAAVIDRATGAAPQPFDTAAALAEAIAGALAVPATASDVAAYADAVLPRDDGEAAPPPAVSLRGEAPPAAGSRSLDSGQTFPMPRPRGARSRLPLLVGVVALAIGFAVGFAAQRSHQPPPAAASAPRGGSP